MKRPHSLKISMTAPIRSIVDIQKNKKTALLVAFNLNTSCVQLRIWMSAYCLPFFIIIYQGTIPMPAIILIWFGRIEKKSETKIDITQQWQKTTLYTLQKEKDKIT